jgi:hypothetical protein
LATNPFPPAGEKPAGFSAGGDEIAGALFEYRRRYTPTRFRGNLLKKTPRPNYEAKNPDNNTRTILMMNSQKVNRMAKQKSPYTRHRVFSGAKSYM